MVATIGCLPETGFLYQLQPFVKLLLGFDTLHLFQVLWWDKGFYVHKSTSRRRQDIRMRLSSANVFFTSPQSFLCIVTCDRCNLKYAQYIVFVFTSCGAGCTILDKNSYIYIVYGIMKREDNMCAYNVCKCTYYILPAWNKMKGPAWSLLPSIWSQHQTSRCSHQQLQESLGLVLDSKHQRTSKRIQTCNHPTKWYRCP